MARPNNPEMLFTASKKLTKGRYSGVDLSNDKDKAVVCVRDVRLNKNLYYHVGAIDCESGAIAWGDTRDYDTGQYPSVALIKLGGKLYTLEVHLSDIFNNCYYKIGKLITSNKSILWEPSVYLGRGKNPKLAANDNGIVVAVKEMSWTYYNYIQLLVGKFDPTTMKIYWKPDQTVSDFLGVEPDVAINLNKIVIACCNNGKIRLKMGNINDNLSIDWVDASCELPPEGDNGQSASPSIALNFHGTIVETHYKQSLLSYCYGRVLEDSILWEKSISGDHGMHPCISLANDGTIFEVHKTDNELLHSKGRVRNQHDPANFLCKDQDWPGVILFQPKMEVRVTQSGKEIYLEEEIGASASIPKDAVDSEVCIILATCFSGSYEVPENVEAISPVYILAADRKVELNKEMTLRIQHTAHLEGKDSKDVFLMEANITPEQDQCSMKRSTKKMECTPAKLYFGVVKVKDLSCTAFMLVRKKEDKNEVAEQKNLYSARVYKSVVGAIIAAVFCVCPEHPQYVQHCDAVIAREYPEYSKAKGTIINSVVIISKDVELRSSEMTAWKVDMDRSEISKLEIDMPQRYSGELAQYTDYPPRIKLQLTPPDHATCPAEFSVVGLNDERSFTITNECTPVQNPAPAQPKREASICDTRKTFRASVYKEPGSHLVEYAMSMAEVKAEIEPLLGCDPGSMDELLKKVQKIEEINQNMQLKKGPKDLQASIQEVSTISHQLAINVSSATKSCNPGDRGDKSWQGSMDVLKSNSVNLIKSIDKLVAAVNRFWTGDNILPGSLTLIKWKDGDEEKTFRLIERVSSKWQAFGYRLKIPQDKLNSWEQECQKDSEKCWMKVMQYWMDGCSEDHPVTWESLYGMLEDIQYVQVARELKKAVSAAEKNKPFLPDK